MATAHSCNWETDMSVVFISSRITKLLFWKDVNLGLKIVSLACQTSEMGDMQSLKNEHQLSQSLKRTFKTINQFSFYEKDWLYNLRIGDPWLP